VHTGRNAEFAAYYDGKLAVRAIEAAGGRYLVRQSAKTYAAGMREG
jgi:hypothetical protein